MKIGQKLILGFLGVALLILIEASLFGIGFKNVRAIFTEIKEDIVPGAIAMLEMDTACCEIEHRIMEYILRGEDKPMLQQAMQTLRQAGERHSEHEQHIGDEERKAAQELNEKIKRVNSIAAETINMKDRGVVIEELLEKDRKELHPAGSELEEILDKHKLIHLEELRKAEGKALQIQTRVTTTILISGILIFCLAIGAGYLISISISRPIMQLKDAAVEMGKGKLNIKVAIKSKDEIGILASAFNEMAENLKDSQEKIQAQNEELNANNEELKAANEELESMNEELMQGKEELEAVNEELRVANEEAYKAKEFAEKKAAELLRFNKVVVERELAMRELKERIRELEGKSEDQGASSKGKG